MPWSMAKGDEESVARVIRAAAERQLKDREERKAMESSTSGISQARMESAGDVAG
ncbi:hypothetical protein VC83_07113 [Pseudogymnoascus destructans]|uniref:Uncharacterized protein n=1 Tax=Pseudogymnoascus destructans TaxID=655981 RepID=A0A177A3L2_9PEZI|nr:uncharacterized protein VC83_07113 [Pseudogymnoascus destructans]OAF56758.1 hypothetical protein VC83_07113 [Pseudogymnoascus destructans]